MTITTKDNRPSRNCVTISVDPCSSKERDRIETALVGNGHHHTSYMPGDTLRIDVAPSHASSALAVVARVLR